MYVHCDVTAVFPWLTYAILYDPRVHRKPRRLSPSTHARSRTTRFFDLPAESEEAISESVLCALLSTRTLPSRS